MPTLDPRIDAYIDNVPDFAKPVLRYLRSIIHAVCPDVVETIKWRSPSFEYHDLSYGFAAFKAHCAFDFWLHERVVHAHGEKSCEAMGSFGRISSLEDLPSKSALTRYIKTAMKLNLNGVKVVRDNTTKDKKPVRMPAELEAAPALAKHKQARARFEAFGPSHRREYREWIGEAKGEETRARRLAQALEWLADGKPRNWKYMNG